MFRYISAVFKLLCAAGLFFGSGWTFVGLGLGDFGWVLTAFLGFVFLAMAWSDIQKIYTGHTPVRKSYYDQLEQNVLYHVVSVMKVPYSGEYPKSNGEPNEEFVIIVERLGRATGEYHTIRVGKRPEHDYFSLSGNSIVPASENVSLLPAT